MAPTNETTTEPTLTDKNWKRGKVDNQNGAVPPNGDALDFSDLTNHAPVSGDTVEQDLQDYSLDFSSYDS
jgi:hypothetical protein